MIFFNLSSRLRSPAACHGGPEEKGYSSTLSLTSALDEVSRQRHATVALLPGTTPGTHSTGVRMDPAPVWTDTGIRSPDLRSEYGTDGKFKI
jgi:hypothetical protein